MKQLGLVCIVFGWMLSAQAADQTPSPKYSPAEVVEVVLNAMAANDQPESDAGIAMAYRFASPANRAPLGPYWHFVAVVKQPAYAPLLNHRNRELGEASIESNAASVPVMVVGQSGEVAGYIWSLSKQNEGEFSGSWMTDSVIRVPLGSTIKSL